jgi:DnaK suppressor protein
MARNDALHRLQKTLVARRNELLHRLGGELKDLRHRSLKSGDSAEMAFGSGSEEISTQLAQLESSELTKIERALERLKQGSYGLCEVCQKRIPVSRLNALPFSSTCIQCQRQMETNGHGNYGMRTVDWGLVSDAEARLNEPHDVDIAQLEIDYSK